jgi:hypothetical protein
MLPALVFSLIFLFPAWWLWKKDLRSWAALPLLTCLILLGFTVAIKLDDVNHRQARADLEVLITELSRSDLYVVDDLTNPDDFIFLAGMASKALYNARAYAPERLGAIDSTLYVLAAWASDEGSLRQWKRNANWDREVFFLAHAGAALAHYQLATGDPAFETAFRAIGEHLGKRIDRGRYKHLLSRPNEDFFRPADNAAALYTLSLYDELYGTTFAEANFNDWTEYLKDELYYAESRLPCAAFSATNRCYLEPTATATGLYIAYRAAARPAAVENDIPWREWLHYFGKTSLSPFSLSIRPNVRAGREARYCEQGAYPLDCNRYEEAVGLWAAAEYGGDYTYFRLYATNALRRWFFPARYYAGLRPARRVKDLTGVALRAVGEGV